MAVALVKETSAGPTTGTTLTCTLASPPTAGNLLVFCMSGDKNTGALTLAGFTEIYSLLSTSVSLYFWWKVSNGTETSISPSWATSSVAGNRAWYAEYQDVAVSGSTWQVSAQASHVTDETTVTAWSTNVTGTISADGMGIACDAVDSTGSVSTVSAWGNSYAVRFSSPSTGSDSGIYVATKLETAGVTTSSQFNYTATADQNSAAIAVFTKVASGFTGFTNTVPPTVTGTLSSGSTLTVNPGTWSPTPGSYTYWWQRADDTAGTNLVSVGSTGGTYTQVAGDGGKYIRAGVSPAQ